MSKPIDLDLPQSSDDNRLVCLGIIGAAHGIRGQVKLRSFTTPAENIASYEKLRDQAGKLYRLTIMGSNNNALIVSIKGITTRDGAEKLRNCELFIERSALAEPAQDEYYLTDLLGLEVVTEDKIPYGHIIAVNNFGAGDLVEIKLTSGKEEFMPFSKAIFPTIEIKNKKLVIVPPEIVS